MSHFATETALVEHLWGAPICSATGLENSCSLIASALGAKHEGWDCPGSCDEPRWMVESLDQDGLGDKWVYGMTDPPDPKTSVCWANPGLWEVSSCTGDLSTCWSLCREGTLEERHIGPGHCPGFWVWNWGLKFGQFAIVPGHKQVHLQTVPVWQRRSNTCWRVWIT